ASYKMDDSQSATVPFAPQFVLLTDFADLDQLLPQEFARVAESGVSPPELSTTWQFSFRAALAPRAPSSASLLRSRAEDCLKACVHAVVLFAVLAAFLKAIDEG